MRKRIVVDLRGPDCVDLQKHQEQQWILGYKFCVKIVCFWKVLDFGEDVSTDALITREDLQGLLMPSRFLVEVTAEVWEDAQVPHFMHEHRILPCYSRIQGAFIVMTLCSSMNHD